MRAKRNSVDPSEAVRLHRDENWRVPDIASRFGVQRPAIYRAFRALGYRTERMHLGGYEPSSSFMPKAPQPGQNPPAIFGARTMRELELAVRPRVSRDPCYRCGVRADVGCRHRDAPALGWFVG